MKVTEAVGVIEKRLAYWDERGESNSSYEMEALDVIEGELNRLWEIEKKALRDDLDPEYDCDIRHIIEEGAEWQGDYYLRSFDGGVLGHITPSAEKAGCFAYTAHSYEGELLETGKRIESREECVRLIESAVKESLNESE